MYMKEISEILDNSKYQVFICASHAHIPFSLAMHSWIVINKKGTLERWEVLFTAKDDATSWGHLHKDPLPPFQGISILPFIKKYFWKSMLLGYIEGEEGSYVNRIIHFIEQSKDTYPYRYYYMMTGPNSNTFVEWVLDAFPEFNLKLPMEFIGKQYK